MEVTLSLPSNGEGAWLPRSPAQSRCPACRLWQHVTRAIREGDQRKATQKFSLEEAQRQWTHRCQPNLVPWTSQLYYPGMVLPL